MDEKTALRNVSGFVPGARLRMNIIPPFFNTLLPWCIFIGVNGVLTFRFHHAYPWFTRFIVLGALLPVFIFGHSAYQVRKRRDPNPKWHKFACLSCFLAHLTATIVGEANFEANLQPYYILQDMKAYPLLDARFERGQNTMDAGRVSFADGNHLDLGKSWHFTRGTVYCVAPIVGASPPSTGSYDYWAVGTDCCSASSADFRCGDYDKMSARSGLRSLDLVSMPLYRLAVQQAEIVHNLFSAHPIFFTWTTDPLAKMQKMKEDGFNMFLMSCFAYFVVCLILMLIAMYKFAWIGRIRDPEDSHATA